MEQTAIEPRGTIPLSTTLDPHTYSMETGGGRPSLADKGAPEASSIEGVMTAELDRMKASEKAESEPAEPKVKADEADKDEKDKDAPKEGRTRSEKGQFAKPAEAKADEQAEQVEGEKDAEAQSPTKEARQTEGRNYSEPPSRFLPKAREVWANVPNAVKADLQRISQEDETEKAQYRESHTRYQQIKSFDDLMRQNGRDLPERLEMFRQVEETLSRDPVAAVDRIFKEAGLNINVYDLAHHVMQNGPEAYQQRSQQAQQQSVRDTSTAQIKALQDRIDSMQMEQTTAAIIEPFKAQNPRFHELQDDIAFFLESGKIPASLSPEERLEAAYDMAVRINPRPSVSDDEPEPAPAKRPDRPVDPAGRKSIRGAPSDGFDPAQEEPDSDLDTLLRRELKKMQR